MEGGNDLLEVLGYNSALGTFERPWRCLGVLEPCHVYFGKELRYDGAMTCKRHVTWSLGVLC